MAHFKMHFIFTVLALIFVYYGEGAFVSLQPESLNKRLGIVKKILKDNPLIDGHNDLAANIRTKLKNHIAWFPFEKDLRSFLPWENSSTYHTDLSLLIKGMVNVQFWSAWTSCESNHQVIDAIEQIDVIHRLIEKYPKYLQFVDSVEGIEETFSQGRIASLIGLEGGHMINSSLAALRMFYNEGVRYLTLTHDCNTPWAESSSLERNNSDIKGLSNFGEAVIKEMNRLGMMVDLSHTSAQTMADVLNVTLAPVIFSHSGVRKLCNHTRNVPDEILTELPTNGGLVMVDFYKGYITCSDNATLADVIDHINYIRNISGIDHVGLGSDFDGADNMPDGLENVSRFPYLLAELLLEPNWTEDDLKKLAGQNLMRVFKKVEEVRDSLENMTPVERLITDVDFLSVC